jgi:hypothetical protein
VIGGSKLFTVRSGGGVAQGLRIANLAIVNLEATGGQAVSLMTNRPIPRVLSGSSINDDNQQNTAAVNSLAVSSSLTVRDGIGGPGAGERALVGTNREHG